MENNENITENTEVSGTPDTIQSSPSDNTVVEEPTETTEQTEATNTEVEEQTEEVTEEETEVPTETETTPPIDYTETLLTISEHVQLTSARVEYMNCLLIVIILIVLLNYVYKFFKMFF